MNISQVLIFHFTPNSLCCGQEASGLDQPVCWLQSQSGSGPGLPMHGVPVWQDTVCSACSDGSSLCAAGSASPREVLAHAAYSTWARLSATDAVCNRAAGGCMELALHAEPCHIHGPTWTSPRAST